MIISLSLIPLQYVFSIFFHIFFFLVFTTRLYLSLVIVTVVEAPISFSLFPSTDCMLYSHFSFNDLVMVAFPDLTRDLDDQI